MDQQFQVSHRLMFFKNVLSTNQKFSVRVVVVKTSEMEDYCLLLKLTIQ